MRAFYLAWTEDVQILQQPAIELKQSKLSQAAIDSPTGKLQQSAGEIKAANLSQPVTEFRKTKLAQPAQEFDGVNLPQVISEIPWFHNVILNGKIKSPAERLWYARQTLEHGWSRAVLEHQIETGLYERRGKAVTNFAATLPPPQSDLARQILKDPYIFDFLTLDAGARELELHRALLDHIRDFLLELGAGFAFVGSEYHLEIGGADYYIDLLFYHLKLRAYIAVELKTTEFKPEHAGKMNFYLSAMDDILRHPDDQPGIGIILCKTREKVAVEYALRDMRKPIGVSRYQITRILPKRLKSSLPTIKELEAELQGDKS